MVPYLLQYSPYTNNARIQAIDDEFNTFSIGGGQGYHTVSLKKMTCFCEGFIVEIEEVPYNHSPSVYLVSES